MMGIGILAERAVLIPGANRPRMLLLKYDYGR